MSNENRADAIDECNRPLDPTFPLSAPICAGSNIIASVNQPTRLGLVQNSGLVPAQ